MTLDLFSVVKAALTVPEVATEYATEPNRAGFIRCPFHAERTPSMKIYRDSYHCFGCGAHGDAVDFVARLFGLDPMEAVKKLNDDFHLRLDLNRGPPDPDKLRQWRKTQEARRLFSEWKESTLNLLDAAIRGANLADYDKLTEAEAAALRYREFFEHLADVLLHGDLEDQMSVFRNREGVEQLCKTILQNTRTKSPAA